MGRNSMFPPAQVRGDPVDGTLVTLAEVDPLEDDSRVDDREAARILTLEGYAVLDTLPEQAYDDLAVLAAEITGASMGFINLVDGARVWAKARHGMAFDSCPRDEALCSTAVAERQTLVVEDAWTDARFSSMPMVANRAVRTYAGAPLMTGDGQALGTLCVADARLIELSSAKVASLEALARQVVAQLELRRQADQLTQSNRRYQSLVELSPNGIVVLQDGAVRFANGATVAVLGLPAGAVALGRSFSGLLHPRSRRAAEAHQHLVESDPEAQRANLPLTLLDGREVTLAVTSAPIEWEGRPAVQVELTDITEQAATERRVWLSERRLQALFTHAPVGQLETDIDGIILDVNPHLCRMLGYRADELVGRSAAIFSPGLSTGEFLEARAGQIDHYQAQRDYRRKDGSVLPALSSTGVITDPQGRPDRLVAMVLDISDLRAREDELQHRADHDVLTGLTNRHALAQPWLEPGRGGAVLYIDLDLFKAVNDTWGHQAGDAVLVAVAGRLRELVRPMDRVVRVGGDEFVVLCPGLTGERRTRDLARRVRAALAEPMPWGGRMLPVGASVGFAVGPDGADGTALIDQADQAMYREKTARRAPRTGNQAGSPAGSAGWAGSAMA
jgi:diguanylate cyclase (GGDEF)-like protein/PAS domain S-box-containing protein